MTEPAISFDGKRVVVIGGASGIGFAGVCGRVTFAARGIAERSRHSLYLSHVEYLRDGSNTSCRWWRPARVKRYMCAGGCARQRRDIPHIL